MIRDGDSSLLNFVTYKLDFILCLQYCLLDTVIRLLTGGVPHSKLDSARISLVTVLAQVLEQYSFFAIPAHRLWTIKGLFSPAFGSSMQRIGPIVGSELVRLAIQAFDLRVRDAIGDATNGLSEECAVRGLIWLGRGKAQHDILSGNAEFLDDRALGQKRESVLGRHGDRVMVGLFVLRLPDLGNKLLAVQDMESEEHTQGSYVSVRHISLAVSMIFIHEPALLQWGGSRGELPCYI